MAAAPALDPSLQAGEVFLRRWRRQDAGVRHAASNEPGVLCSSWAPHGEHTVDHDQSTDAVGLLSDRPFDVLGSHRVEVTCERDDTASRAVARREGFRLEGRLRSPLPTDRTSQLGRSR
ncbi:MAG: GNAT family protein [Quadrisphaera sp.]